MRFSRRLAIAVLAAVAAVGVGTGTGIVLARSRPQNLATIGGPGVHLIRVPGEPRYVAVGDGRVWATVHDGHWPMVVSIDPAHARVVSGPVRVRVPAGCEDAGLAEGAGQVWTVAFPLEGGGAVRNGFLLRTDPSTGATASIAVGKRPLGVAFGFGSVWVANDADGTVSRVDPISDRVVTTIHVGPDPIGISAGGSHVWVWSGTRSGTWAIDPAKNRTAFTVRGVRAPAISDGTGWALDDSAPAQALVRFDPATGSTEASFPMRSAYPVHVVAGAGMVWILRAVENPAEAIDERSIPIGGWPALVTRAYQFDPRTGRTVGRGVTVDGLPRGAVVLGGSLWVASAAAKAILQLP